MNSLPRFPKWYWISSPSPLKVLTSVERARVRASNVCGSLCAHIPHICVFKINHICLREIFAFIVLSLICNHRVNIPKSSFTLWDEWECPHGLVSPGLWDIPSADKELIRTFFILPRDVISQRWCENSCFMSDLHPVFQQPYSNAVSVFWGVFLPHIPPTVTWTKSCSHTHKPPAAPCPCSITVYLACNKAVCLFVSMFDALYCKIFYHIVH